MGSKKLATLLREGKISKKEYDVRLAQSQDDKRLTSTVSKGERKPLKNIRKLQIPAYKQDSMMQLASSGGTSLVRKYLASLTAPKYNMSRVPDSDTRGTSTVRSIQVFDIMCATMDSDSEGRFGCFIQPILGSIAAISDFKVGIVADAGWGGDLTNPTNWLSSIGGQDPRVDSFAPTLTQPQNGYFKMNSNTGTPAAPFSGVQNYDPLNYNYGQMYDTASNSFRPPPGIYEVIGFFQGVGITNVTLNVFSGLVASNVELSIAALSATAATLSAIIVVSAPGQSLSFTVTASGVTFASFTLTPIWTGSTTITPNIVPPMDYGPVTSIRPVSMSALCSYIGPLLTNGGNVAAAWLPSQTLNSQIITNVIGGGSQQNVMYWEALAKVPESYDGPIKDGTYVWWSEQDITNTKFYSPSASLNVDYPILAVSGQWNPGNPVDSTPVMRLEIVTVYEFTTTSLLWESEVCVGSVAEMDMTNKLLAGQAHAMPNGAHLDWIKKMLGKASGIYQKNKSWINPMVTTLGALALS